MGVDAEKITLQEFDLRLKLIKKEIEEAQTLSTTSAKIREYADIAARAQVLERQFLGDFGSVGEQARIADRATTTFNQIQIAEQEAPRDRQLVDQAYAVTLAQQRLDKKAYAAARTALNILQEHLLLVSSNDTRATAIALQIQPKCSLLKRQLMKQLRLSKTKKPTILAQQQAASQYADIAAQAQVLELESKFLGEFGSVGEQASIADQAAITLNTAQTDPKEGLEQHQLDKVYTAVMQAVNILQQHLLAARTAEEHKAVEAPGTLQPPKLAEMVAARVWDQERVKKVRANIQTMLHPIPGQPPTLAARVEARALKKQAVGNVKQALSDQQSIPPSPTNTQVLALSSTSRLPGRKKSALPSKRPLLGIHGLLPPEEVKQLSQPSKPPKEAPWASGP